jgi:hypothetical protein
MQERLCRASIVLHNVVTLLITLLTGHASDFLGRVAEYPHVHQFKHHHHYRCKS